MNNAVAFCHYLYVIASLHRITSWPINRPPLQRFERIIGNNAVALCDVLYVIASLHRSTSWPINRPPLQPYELTSTNNAVETSNYSNIFACLNRRLWAGMASDPRQSDQLGSPVLIRQRSNGFLKSS